METRCCSAYSSILDLVILSSVMGGSWLRSLVRTWSAVAIQALRSVEQDRIRALLAAVAVRLSAAATLTSVAASGEVLFSRERKNFGHLLSRSSLMVVWPLSNHLAYKLWVARCSAHTYLIAVPLQFMSLVAPGFQPGQHAPVEVAPVQLDIAQHLCWCDKN